VAPEKIENIYVRCSYVAQSFVHGESLKTCLVAIVVPDPDVLPGAAAEKLGIKGKSMEELCELAEVKQMILDDMISCGKKSGLYSFEQVCKN
jgi:long-chain acyl-CoA synthetase